MLSLSLIAVPVLLDTTKEAPELFRQWTRMYHYGHQVLPTMAVGTFILYTHAATKKQSAGKPWATFAVAGLVTLSMLPFTWLVMVPTNNELFQLELVSRSEPFVASIESARELVVRWSWMHFTRALLPLSGAILGAVATFGPTV